MARRDRAPVALQVRTPRNDRTGRSSPWPASRAVAPENATSWSWIVAVVLVLAVAFGLGVWPIARSDPLPADAPSDVFSAGRAMQHVRVIAARPHPAGSPAMAGVAGYIEGELRDVGIETRVQVVTREGITIRNVVGRIRGSGPTGAVLFVSHPDSVPFGPGAGDNATGAAALLEVSRALAAGARLRNDVIVLFDDDEEGGNTPNDPPFGGGWAFAEGHPWMKDVRLVVGMDTAAWGVPHVLQTSDEDGLIVRGYADGVDDPVAFGAIAALTDGEFETFPFRERGLPAVELEDNYADNVQHTADDTVAHVEPASLQHMGDQVLDLARAYGGMDLTDSSTPSRVFHTFPVVGVVDYPVSWSTVLVLVAVLAWFAVAVLAVRRGSVAGRNLLKGVGVATALVVGTTVLALLAAALYEALFPNPSPHPVEEYLLDSSWPFEIAALALIAIAFGFAYRRLGRRVGHVALALGFLALYAAFSILFAVAAPGAAYVAQWPLMLACAAWLPVLLRGDRAGPILLVPAAATVFLLAPVIWLGFLSDGVAGLPDLAPALALAGGLIATAVARPSPVPPSRPPIHH